MPMINLIQEQRFEARRSESKTRTAVFALIGAAGLSVLGYGALFVQGQAILAEQTATKQKIDRVAPLTKKIESNAMELGQLSPKLGSLEEARNVTQQWRSILQQLSYSIPPNLWLTNLRCSQPSPKDPVTVSFVGMSGTQEHIGDFLMNVQAMTELTNVQLKYTQGKIADKTMGIEFEISGDLIASMPKPEKKSEEKSASKEPNGGQA